MIKFENGRRFSSVRPIYVIKAMMNNVITQRGYCTIRDFYILSGTHHTPRSTDECYGWRSADALSYGWGNRGYFMKLEEPENVVQPQTIWDDPAWNTLVGAIDIAAILERGEEE